MRQTRHIAAVMGSSVTGCDVSDTGVNRQPCLTDLCEDSSAWTAAMCKTRESQVGQEFDVDFQAVLLGE